MSTQKDTDMTLDQMIQNDKTGKYKRLRQKRRTRNFRNIPKKDSRRRIKVENLNREMQNADLTKLFEPFGKLTRCGIHYDKMGASTGYADIEFSNHEECEAAIQKLDNADINGVVVRVKYASNFKNFRNKNSASVQRRNLRKVNRSSRRVNVRRRVGLRRNNVRKLRVGTRRRVFTRTLGRKRVTKKK